MILLPDNQVLNTGFMIIKKSDFNIKLMDIIWNNKNDFDKNFHEQASLSEIYTRDTDIKNKIKILDNDDRNEIVRYWGQYEPDKSFSIHIARCSHDKINFLNMMDAYYPFKIEEETIKDYIERMFLLYSIDEYKKFIIDNIMKIKSKNYPVSARLKYNKNY